MDISGAPPALLTFTDRRNWGTEAAWTAAGQSGGLYFTVCWPTPTPGAELSVATTLFTEDCHLSILPYAASEVVKQITPPGP